MRLMHVESKSIVDVPPEEVGKIHYAILSHRWGADEVLFEDIKHGTGATKRSFRKIVLSCQQAQRDMLQYVWIDSCCIDKSSSAELSEAINSMFLWYQRARVCYAYLEDVSSMYGDSSTESRSFANSGWFQRGWTLQELLAPSNVIFYSADWIELGVKIELSEELSEITGIDEGVLRGEAPIESVSVAQRMSWAAHRQTSRPEDVAYCLMGIFSVNMPMLYGEGERAFLRLQEEIMRHSDDHSLFAWIDKDGHEDSLHGLLATSPSFFAESKHVMSYLDQEQYEPFSTSNRGLRITLPLTRLEDDLYVAALYCPVPPEYDDSTFLGLYLRRLSSDGQQFSRTRIGDFAHLQALGKMQTIFVRQSTLLSAYQGIYSSQVFQLRRGPSRKGSYRLMKILVPPSEQSPPDPLRSMRRLRDWVPRGSRYTFDIPKGVSLLAGVIVLEHEDKQKVCIMLGSASAVKVAFDVRLLNGREGNANNLFKSLQALFDPKTPGTHVSLEDHWVRVTAEPQVHSGIKYYLVDIEVETVDRFDDIESALQDGIEEVAAWAADIKDPKATESNLFNTSKRHHPEAQGRGDIRDLSTVMRNKENDPPVSTKLDMSRSNSFQLEPFPKALTQIPTHLVPENKRWLQKDMQPTPR